MLAESGATDMDFSLDGQWVIYAAREMERCGRAGLTEAIACS